MAGRAWVRSQWLSCLRSGFIGRTLGQEELGLLAEAIKSAMLFSPKGGSSRS